jgi:transcriptional activator SPT8
MLHRMAHQCQPAQPDGGQAQTTLNALSKQTNAPTGEPDQKTEISDADISTGPVQPAVNGLPKAEDLETPPPAPDFSHNTQQEQSVTSDNMFLAASIDGTIRVWDRRQLDPVARITPDNSPPWCMNACWSPDGNSLSAVTGPLPCGNLKVRSAFLKPLCRLYSSTVPFRRPAYM